MNKYKEIGKVYDEFIEQTAKAIAKELLTTNTTDANYIKIVGNAMELCDDYDIFFETKADEAGYKFTAEDRDKYGKPSVWRIMEAAYRMVIKELDQISKDTINEHGRKGVLV